MNDAQTRDVVTRRTEGKKEGRTGTPTVYFAVKNACYKHALADSLHVRSHDMRRIRARKSPAHIACGISHMGPDTVMA